MRIQFIFFSALMCFSWISLRGQNTFSSPYSVYGVGLLNERTSSFNRAMGGTGIAVQDASNLNLVNPASYGTISSPISHIFEAGIYTGSNRYMTSNLSEVKTNGGLNNMDYWFKLKPAWASLIGISPFSSVSYNVTTQKDLGSNATAAYAYTGSGNITQLYWGNSVTLAQNFSVGMNISYLFGSIHKTESLAPSAISRGLTLDNKISTNKLNLDFGVQYKINFTKRVLTFGAIYNNGITLQGKNNYILYNTGSDTLQSYSGKNIKYKLPRSAGVGLALNSKRSIFATDVKYKQWSQASFSDQALSFTDTWRFSGGYSYLGNPNASNFFGLISLKTGVYAENYNLYLKNNNPVSWGFSLGASIPVFDGRSSVNLTYSFDRMGTLQNNLILQQSQNLMIDVVIRDLWGIKRKFD